MANSTERHTFLKDLQHLYRKIDTSTDGQAAVIGIDDMSVRVSLQPKRGYNAHAVFVITIKASLLYPRDRPSVIFHTPILHPNVNVETGFVCISLLNEWQSCYSLLDVVKAVLYVLEHPVFDSPHIMTCDDPREFAMRTARFLAGLPVKGQRFPPNTAWCEWAVANGCLPTDDDDEEEEEATEAETVVAKVDAVDMQTSDAVGNLAAMDNARNGVGVLQKEAAFGLDVPDGASLASSDSVPSFAKIRYSICSNIFDPSAILNVNEHRNFVVETHSVVIWPPTDDAETDEHSVFYFAELLGSQDHSSELGSMYTSLFVGSVLRDSQEHGEARQTSSVSPWYPWKDDDNEMYYSEGTYTPSVYFAHFFETAGDRVRRDLTADFCPWAAEDHRGKADILRGLFFEETGRNRAPHSFLDVDDGIDEGDEALARLFACVGSDSADVGSADVGAQCEEASTMSETATEWTMPSEASAEVCSEASTRGRVGASAEEEKGPEDDAVTAADSESSITFQWVNDAGHRIRDCRYCNYDYGDVIKGVNVYLQPRWKWLFRQTRWSIRFAPQQTVDLSTSEVSIPPWRVSTGRLLSDVSRFCGANREVRSLVLLDPLALSPLSPLLNLMRHESTAEGRVSGVLWMTTLDALSPCYRVPLGRERREGVAGAQAEATWAEEAVEVEVAAAAAAAARSGESGGRRRRRRWSSDSPYPRPGCLRFLVVTAFVANWVAWLSRVEAYASLGASRFRPAFVCESVAANVVHAFTLACGQTPLVDLWPLWLLRNFLTLCLRLPRLRASLRHPVRHHVGILVPFSDLDEI